MVFPPSYLLIAIAIAIALGLLWYYERCARKQYRAVACTAYDRMAIDQSILVLHAYAQSVQKKPINFKQEIIENRFFVHLSKPDAPWAGWSFYKMQGYSGLVDYGG